MDKGTIMGLIGGLGAIVISVVLEGGYLASFINLAAFIVIFGGTIGATTINCSVKEMSRVPGLIKKAFAGNDDYNLTYELIHTFVMLSQKARKEGILSLQEEIDKLMVDPFMVNGLQLVIDGADENIVREVLATEISMTRERHRIGANIFQTMGGYAPTMGIIGTVMGLIHVMSKMGADMDSMGKGVALAFVATLYGILSANLIFLPIAGNLKNKSEEEIRLREIILEGILGIQAGQNPFVLEQRLLAHFKKITEKKETQELND